MVDVAEVVALLADRASMYQFLSRLYKVEVDQELLDRLAGLELAAETDEPEIAEGYRMLTGYLGKVGPGTLTDLAVDYARVFLGAGILNAGAAYPYESVYTSPEKLIMQDARDQVLALYRAEGLDRSDELDVPEDHVALELEFMAHLSQKTAEALEGDDTATARDYLAKQGALVRDHLMVWVPAFCEDILKIADTDFYRAVARITSGYVAAEPGLIAELSEAISQ